jgi:hypothetical protein
MIPTIKSSNDVLIVFIWNGMEWNGMEWNGMEWNGYIMKR